MKALMIAVFSMAALMFAPVAHADAYTDIDKCDLLMRDFDQVMMLHPSAASAESAAQQRAEAGDLCAAGDPAAGLAKLAEAFATIGVTPRSYS